MAQCRLEPHDVEVVVQNGSPSHRRSIRQAIEEGVILDVLKHCTTYATMCC
jgi:hypothetical protein